MKVESNPNLIKLFATRNRCWMCKHKFDNNFLLPSKDGEPNYNPEFLFHLYETHGIEPEVVVDWVWGTIHGLKTNTFGYELPVDK